MASKVLVKLPTVSFLQGKKPPSDIVTLTERNENLNQTVRHQNINIDRVAQLEQNMKFLQEQHQATLVALHQEVESLRQKNRDLQFQLVFSKGSTCAASSPSSPEDNGTGFVKSKGSPVCVNISSLQVELLEKDLQDTKISLQEAKNQNQYLSEIIEQQKKKLESTEEQPSNKQSMIDVGIQVENKVDPVRQDLVSRLEVSEAMVERLRKRNKDQRKEIRTLEAASANTSQEQMPHKFPPLQSQSYWHCRAPRCGRNLVLPQLQNGNMKTDTMIFESPFYRSQGYRNYYRDESNRKYRGQSSQKDRRDSDNYHHRRQFKDRSSKVHQKELVDSTEESTEADNSTGSKS
nr:PREDICTED: uncharacterized protein LOC100879876 [Megachile rotundata]XP_012145485.1 PREDICTED: uncharacterized protein LOC100879876 [Megachile rotundata]